METGITRIAVEGYKSIIPHAQGNIVIQVRIVPSLSKFAFDWVSNGTPYLVNAYIAGPPDKVELTTDITGSSLEQKITGGKTPRIQVASTSGGAPQIPAVATVTAHAVVSGKSRLTLQNPIAVPPAGGGTEDVFPGGPVTATIGQAVLGYVNTLGPSRQSGYADPDDLWEDSIAIFRLAEIALDQTDVDGVTKLASNIKPSGITINGTGSDLEASDYGTDPSILVPQWIFVTD